MNTLVVPALDREVEPLPPAGTITYRGLVYPWHCDHMGHMNVMWYTSKFDEAAWSFLSQLGITSAYLREQDRRMAAVELNFTYRQELFAGELVTIASAMVGVGGRSLRFSHTMYKEGSSEPVAICTGVGVHLDARTRAACPLPHDIAQRAHRLIGA